MKHLPPEQLILQSIVHNRQAKKDADGTVDHMYGKGLRTEFGRENKHESEILTNFFKITSRPSYLFVYKITFIRRWVGEGEDAKAIYVKNKFDKQALFEEMIKRLHITAPDCWVTDYDTIWSTQRLLEDETFDISPKRAPNLSATNPNSFKAIHCEDAWIEYDRVIDLSKSVGEIFRYANGRTEGVDDPAVLVRGINAMVTALARRRNFDGITSTSANKFYYTEPAQNLSDTLRALCGFSASVRPGADRLLLNISPKCSPFLKNMTAARFIADHGSRNLGPIQAALKGVKVRITYDMHPNFTEAERTKFIMGIGTSLDSQTLEDGTTLWNYYQQPFFPHAALTPLTKESYAINVGGNPLKRSEDKNKESEKDKKRMKPEWYPSEHLQIVDYPSYRDKLTGDQTSAMIDIALKAPKDQREEIESQGLDMFGLRDDRFQTDLRSMFGLAISTDLCKVPCRFLPAPRLTYGGGQSPKINRASWNLNKTAFCTSGNTIRIPILDLSCLRQPKADEVPDHTPDMRPMVSFASDQNEGPTSLPDSFPNYLNDQISMLGMTSISLEGPFRPSLLKQSGLLENIHIDEDKLMRIFYWATSQNTMAPPVNTTQITLVVVIPQENAALYAAIKRVADLKMGLNTVCCAASQMQRFGTLVRGREQGPQHRGNIALKLNLKGAGDNHRVYRSQFPELYNGYHEGTAPLPNDQANTIVLGADVTHPIGHCAPGCPSIAALVGSVDDNFAQFPGSMRLQRSRQERIEDLQYMVKERLLAWADRHDKQLPMSMLFYRDGVSESQFEEVRKHEINAVAKGYDLAQAELESVLRQSQVSMPDGRNTTATDDDVTSPEDGGGDKPVEGASEEPAASAPKESHSLKQGLPFKLTFVVVGKRHSARFYPQPGKETNDSWASSTGVVNGNVLPGCVVDQGITHPYIFDFYLQSHQPLRGTGRSAHYFVLQNNMKLSADRLQSVTYSFCYNYARATKGVSYCAPAYYADRLCDRGREYIRHWLTDGDNYKADRDREKNETVERFNDYVKDFLHDTSYYRPNQGQSQNPWHPNMDNIMFYL